jgi:hypothetical protein
LEVVAAELSTLVDELRVSGRSLVGASFLFLAALGLGILGLGFAAQGVVAVLAIYFPEWAAAGMVGVALMGGGAVFWYVGRRRLARLEPPLATVKRRLQEHDDWWQEKVAGPMESTEEPDNDNDNEVS